MKRNDLYKALAFAVACIAVTANASDMPDGFRGIKWGQSSTALGPDTTKVRSHRYAWGGTIECYLRAHEPLELGHAELKEVRYCFYNDRFDSVEVVADARYKASLHNATERAFGLPDHPGGIWGSRERIPGRSSAMIANFGAEVQLVFMANDSTTKADLMKYREQEARKQEEQARKQF